MRFESSYEKNIEIYLFNVKFLLTTDSRQLSAIKNFKSLIEVKSFSMYNDKTKTDFGSSIFIQSASNCLKN